MPLPTHRLEIRQKFSNWRWSNDYLLYVADFAEGEAVANALVEFHRRMSFTLTTFEFYVLSTYAKDGRVFRHKAVNATGYASLGTAQLLPLFNTVRVDLNTLDGDPARKYLRAIATEGDQDTGVWVAASVSSWQSVINTYLVNSVALDNIVTPKGRVVTGATVHNVVQERQLRRRRKKKDV